MCGMIGHVKPALATDFGEYALGIQLRNTGEWVDHSDAATAAFPLSATLIADDQSISGRTVLVDQGGHGTFKALTWYRADAANGNVKITDCELLAGVRFVDLPTSAGGLGVCRVNGSSGYAGCFDSDGSPDSVNAIRINSGALDIVVGGTPQDLTLSAGPRFWVRFRINGTNIGVKGWQDGTAEPAAFSSGTDTTFGTGGRVGFQSMANRGYRLDWFSVALGDGTAPFPNG